MLILMLTVYSTMNHPSFNELQNMLIIDVPLDPLNLNKQSGVARFFFQRRDYMLDQNQSPSCVSA